MIASKKVVARIDREVVKATMDRVLRATPKELASIVNGKATSNLELMLASVVMKSIVNGDERAADWALQVLIGEDFKDPTTIAIDSEKRYLLRQVPSEKLVEVIRSDCSDKE